MWDISFFNSVEEAWVAHSERVDFATLGTLLTECRITDNKHDQMLFSLSRFKTVEEGAQLARRYKYIEGMKTNEYEFIPNRVRRCKENLVSLSGLVLDVDGAMSLEDAIKLLEGLCMIVYTTHGNTWTKNKFRVVIPFSQPLLAADIEARKLSIIETFPGVDLASFSNSQSFYLHSSPNPELALSAVIDGEFVNPYDFEARPVKLVVENTQPNDQNVSIDYVEAVFSSLLTCSGVHYQSDKGQHSGVLTLITICRSINMNFENFDNLCAQICDPSSQLVNPQTRHQAWIGWDGNKITRDKRDAFIKANGGRPVTMPNRVVRSNEDLTRMVKRLNKK